jgi:transmembrane sensor
VSDLSTKLRDASREIAYDAAARSDELRRDIDARLRSRAKVRRVALAAGVASAAVVILLLWNRARPPAEATLAPPAVTSPSSELRLSDGSTASRLTPNTELALEVDSVARSVLHLGAGAASFAVQPRGQRPFVVRSDPFEVRVIGTKFTLSRTAERALRVEVSEGKVEVSGPAGVVRLSAGESQVFSASEAKPAVPESAPESLPDAAPPLPRASATNPAMGHWRSLAHSKDYEGAFAALQREGGSAVKDEPQDLLLAADVARLSGHPAEAVQHLTGLLRRFPRDSRAASAAFTLGRLHEQSGKPDRAAQAFARVRTLAPGGPLAEDALAHEVENLARSGQASVARARAGEYLRLYPNGHRVRSIRAHAGTP